MSTTGHILIIDDEASLRHTLARILQQSGLEATTAASGQEGLALLGRHSFDLIYLDIRMPDMNGMETLKAIHARFPGTPVILFTAQPDLNSAMEALREGASDYLLKPLQPQAFIERTQSILERQEKERRKRDIQAQLDALQIQLKSLENDEVVQQQTMPKQTNSSERFFISGKLTLDLHTRHLTIDGQAISLPPTSFDYLLVLARHAPDVVDYQTLVAEAQGYKAEAREAQVLTKWHIHHIRQAIEPDARNPTYLFNVRGSGYRLVTD